MSYAVETKQQKALRKETATQKILADAKDLENLAETLAAVSNLDATKARALVMTPQIILKLLNKTNNIRCPYILHAIFLALAAEDPYQIMDKMTTEDIDTLKRCINVAKSYKFDIDPSIITTQIKSRKAPQPNLTSRQHLDNELVITSLMISKQVVLHWNDASQALQQWTDAMETFTKVKGTKTVAEPEIQKANELLSYKQVAEKIGNTKAIDVYNHITRQIFAAKSKLIATTEPKTITEIRGWFVKSSRGSYKSYMLKSQFFDEYEKLFNKRSIRSPRKSASCTTRMGQLGIKAMETELSAILKLYNKAAQESDNAIQKRQFIQQELAMEINDDRIDELSAMLKKANSEVKSKKAVVEKFERAKILYEKQQQAKSAKDAAEKALREANASLKDVNADIAMFLSKTELNLK